MNAVQDSESAWVNSARGGDRAAFDRLVERHRTDAVAAALGLLGDREEAQDAVQPLVSKQSPGRRPPQVLMQRIDRASLSGAKGEVALGVIAALGVQGAGDLAPDVVVRLVRALQTAGIRDGAREVALEAFLLRPVTSIASVGQTSPATPASGGG